MLTKGHVLQETKKLVKTVSLEYINERYIKRFDYVVTNLSTQYEILLLDGNKRNVSLTPHTLETWIFTGPNAIDEALEKYKELTPESISQYLQK